jgi:hypothetical protein
MADTTSWHLLPTDLLELQIGQVDLLMAMYPQELILEQIPRELLDGLRKGTIGSTSPTISAFLRLPISALNTELPETIHLVLDLMVSFAYEGSEVPQEPPDVKVRIQQPSWMSKAATNRLMSDVPDGEDLLGTIEYIKDAAARQYEQSSFATGESTGQELSTNVPRHSHVRVWFHFPSISTRSKRDDFILHAPSYNLTGFLYAGKPGLLCVEGTSKNIDDYMRFIRTESWSDIPTHQKKVSERYRECGEIQRVFDDITEITDAVGGRKGQRANRGDMKSLEEWLVKRGLGDAFQKVLM